MKLTLDATPEELVEKSEQFLESLSGMLREVSPELSDALEKGLPTKERELKYPVLHTLLKTVEEAYGKQLDAMLADIGKVLDTAVAKSVSVEELDEFQKSVGPYIGPRGGKWADPQHKIPWRDSKESKFQKLVEKVGGKVKPHKTDPNLVMMKVPKEYAGMLAELKTKANLPGEIIVGGKYAMLGVEKKLFGKVAEVAKPKKKPKAKPKAGKATVMKAPAHAKAEWKPHQTVQEAADWAEGHGVATDYPNIEVANACNQALSEQHPDVIAHVQFMGTGSQLKAWAKAHPAENAVAMKEAKHKLDMASQSPLGGGAIAVAHPYTKKPYTKSVIIVADSYFTKSYAESTSDKGGFSLTVGLGDTMRHEMGHVEGFAMRHLYPSGGDKSMWEIWKSHAVQALKAGIVKSTVSPYGGTNPHECWAEVSVMRRKGKPIADWIKKAFKAMSIDDADWGAMKGGAK